MYELMYCFNAVWMLPANILFDFPYIIFNIFSNDTSHVLIFRTGKNIISNVKRISMPDIYFSFLSLIPFSPTLPLFV